MNFAFNYKKYIHASNAIPIIGQHAHSQYIQLQVALGHLSHAREMLQQVSQKNEHTLIDHVYADLSVISMNDAGTGIQRLVKSVWNRLEQPNISYTPIYATRKKKYAISHYPEAQVKKRRYVHLKSGDLFFGLDWSADQIIRHQKSLYQWKKDGAKLIFILNDILALQHPEWFTRKNRQKLCAWLKVISVCADEIICVSAHVKKQVETWLNEHDIFDLKCSSIMLGAEIDTSHHQTKIRPDFAMQFLQHSYHLKVSTIEPRKGHLCLVKAYEHLLATHPDYPHHLYLVGRYGWHAEDTVNAIRNSPYFNQRIFWFDDIQDDELKLLYENASGVINASYGEGFGLPLMEAIYYQKPLLVRDLQVFHEVTSQQATYFKEDSSQALADTIYAWGHNLNSSDKHIIPLQSWDQTTAQLLDIFKTHGVGSNISK